MFIKITLPDGQSALRGPFSVKSDCRIQLTSRHYRQNPQNHDLFTKEVPEGIIKAEIVDFGPILPTSTIP